MYSSALNILEMKSSKQKKKINKIQNDLIKFRFSNFQLTRMQHVY